MMLFNKKQALRIGINATVFKNPLSGVGKRLLGLIIPLAHNCPEYQFFFFTHHSFSLKQISPILAALENITLVRSRSPGEFYWNHLQLPLLLKKYKIDLFDSQWGGGLPYFFPLKFCRYVTTIHDLIPLQHTKARRLPNGMGYEIIAWLQDFWFKQKIRSNLFIADLIITVSQNTKNQLLKQLQLTLKEKAALEKKIKIVPNGINYFELLEEKKRPVPAPKDFFYYVGGFSQRKNVETLLLAFEKLQQDFPHFASSCALLLSGKINAYCRKYLLPIREKLTFKKKIHFLDYSTESDLAFYYTKAVSLIYPSLVEGFAIPPLEAALYGCPSITHSLPALREIRLPQREEVDMRRIPKLTAAMLKRLQQPLCRKQLQAQARPLLKKFDWKKLSRSYQNYYKSLVTS